LLPPRSFPPQEAAVLYVDGHVRVYYGNTKQLPKHYIARERLCLSATADYWVNAMDGKPFFVVSQAVDPGLLQVLEQGQLGCDVALARPPRKNFLFR
jgi:prepilin-type processing-associated H-X9-DG protein